MPGVTGEYHSAIPKGVWVRVSSVLFLGEKGSD